MSLQQLDVGRDRLRIARGSVEPLVSAQQLLEAIEPAQVELFRPLLPVGYRAVAAAYARAAGCLTEDLLTNHYTQGLEFFQQQFVPLLKSRLHELTGGAWQLDDFVAFGAGSDVDFMSHVIEAVAARDSVVLYPGDWYGFYVGCTHQQQLAWNAAGVGGLACLCVPSVRNGQLTDEMLAFLEPSSAALLNLNLFPTLVAAERFSLASKLQPLLKKSLLSISFSRGFGLTASQLGVCLVHRDHPLREQFQQQWDWYTYYFNWIAAKAFMEIDHQQLANVDTARREWVSAWLQQRGLPDVPSGSYYIKSFQVDGPVPDRLKPLVRDNVVRLCFKPPQT